MQYVVYEKIGPIVTIRMNRPERLNAYGRDMKNDLWDAWERFGSDPSARAAILTGTGRAFCAGRDIKEQVEGVMGNAVEDPRRMQLTLIPPIDKPIIAAVNGLALGAGFFLAVDSDIRIASDTAEFGVPELPTGVLGPWHLSITQMIPRAIAADLLLTADRISARRAYEIGLISRIVRTEELLPTATRVARQLVELPQEHLAATLSLLHKSRPLPAPELLDEQDAAHTRLLSLASTKEAAEAFVEKRARNTELDQRQDHEASATPSMKE